MQVAEYAPAALLRTSGEHGGELRSSVGCTRGAPAVPAPEGAPWPREDNAGVFRQGPGCGEGSDVGAAAVEGDRKVADRVQAAHASSGLAGWHAGGAETAALDRGAAKARRAEAPQKADFGVVAEVLEDPGGCDLRSDKRQRM